MFVPLMSFHVISQHLAYFPPTRSVNNHPHDLLSNPMINTFLILKLPPHSSSPSNRSVNTSDPIFFLLLSFDENKTPGLLNQTFSKSFCFLSLGRLKLSIVSKSLSAIHLRMTNPWLIFIIVFNRFQSLKMFTAKCLLASP